MLYLWNEIVLLICISIKDLASSETTKGITNEVTYQNTTMSEQITAKTSNRGPTTTEAISKRETTEQRSTGISDLLIVEKY